MIAILSPSKTMLAGPYAADQVSLPRFPAESTDLVNILKTYSPAQLESLMGISPKLAKLNEERYQQWTWPKDAPTAIPALFSFKGDVYEGLDAGSLKPAGLTFAQKHLRIISGLYGYLRPLDQILPYRLEMGTKLLVGQHDDLYGFWGNKIHDALQEDLNEFTKPVLVNLASNEYYKAILPKKIKANIITPVFLEQRTGSYAMVSFYAKRARGLMARFMLSEQITEPEHLKAFEEEGYQYNAHLSTENQWTFTRA